MSFEVVVYALAGGAFSLVSGAMFFGSTAAYLVPSPPPDEVLARVLVFRLPLFAACAALFWLLRHVERDAKS